jgi:hypothetical protein
MPAKKGKENCRTQRGAEKFTFADAQLIKIAKRHNQEGQE